MRLRPASLAVLSVFVAGLVGVGIWLLSSAGDCAKRWAESGLRAELRATGCYVEAGNRWYIETAIRVHVREPGKL